MKKIGTITFHASYNYGSNLQAYALQEYVKKITNQQCKYEIINLRIPRQKEMYKTCFEKNNFKNKVKRLFFLKKKNELEKKQQYFEEFLNNKLQISKEFNSLDELKKYCFDYDYYISGSDQLWNLQAWDFDWANYLEFVDNGKKISYAASFGPKKQTWNEEEKERVARDLLKYDMLSVREQGSYTNVKELTGIESLIHVDPTMLLTKDEWGKVFISKPIIEGKYIFLYNLKDNYEILKIAKKVSRILKMPVIISRFGNIREVLYGFKAKYDVGPCEFLNLIKNAELVLSSSFHGTIFSILFQKPFFAINGAKDFRIHTLLEKMGLEDRTIELDNYCEKCEKAYDINFKESEKLLEEERKKSEAYLKKALDIK